MATIDSLNINYLKQSRELLSSIPVDIPLRCTSVLTTIRQIIVTHPVEPGRLLCSLSDALAMPELTWLVASAFRPILIELAARWLEDSPAFTLDRLFCLAFLLEVHEELYPILLRLLDDMPSGDVLVPLDVEPPLPVQHYHHALLTVYRLLAVNTGLSHPLKLSQKSLKNMADAHTDRGIRVLAVHCIAMQGGLSEAERDQLLMASLGGYAEQDAPVHVGCVYGSWGDFPAMPLQDGWVLSMFERKRISDLRNLLRDDGTFYGWSTSDHTDARPLTPADLSSVVISICGVLVLRRTSPSNLPPETARRSFVVTKSAHETLRDLALHYSQKLPCLLSSSPSAGKTTLLHHLATLICGNPFDILSIHLADSSIDAKSLLGTYVSSPTSPGTFDWIDGPLVRAMKLGKWLLLEDIDRAGQDVLSTLLPILESMGPQRRIGAPPFVDVPGRGRVYASDEFMVFATRSVSLIRPVVAAPSSSRPFPRSTFFGHQHLSEVTLPVPTMDELPFILQEAFRSLHHTVISLLINVWKAAHDAAIRLRGDTKEVELLALLKLCHRISRLSNVSSALPRGMALHSTRQPSRSAQEEIFLESLDVFVAHITQSIQAGRPRAVVDEIAAVLDISEERVAWILTQRTPELRVSKNATVTTTFIGRIEFQQENRQLSHRKTGRPFALHRPSLRLLEQLAASARASEPVLLVGETGTGKTTAVQHLASMIGPPLTALNLSTQTEATDIVGGLKPIDPRLPATELQERYMGLFANTFSRKRNASFVDSVRKAFVQGKWLRLSGLWRESSRLALERLSPQLADGHDGPQYDSVTSKPKKRRKVDTTPSAGMPSKIASWTDFLAAVAAFEIQHLDSNARFVFAFVEGPLVTALRKGEWILLDEINLASPDVLESILSILEGPDGSLTLTERGDLQAIPRHVDFRLFACMNPATDIGKRDLPPRIRRHFTEIFVAPPEADKNALLAVVEQYLGGHALGDRSCLLDIVELYLAVKELASLGQLADGANQAPHYNMRTLTRMMTYAVEQSSIFGLRRALWEGFLMCFAMTLDQASSAFVRQAAEVHIWGRATNAKSLLRQVPPFPGESYTDEFTPFYLEKGPLPIPLNMGDYILTPSVRAKLLHLARIIGAKGLPVLIQGPTSSGKTSSIEYLARRTGHRFVRINNHEHTDIQEYLGSYISDPTSGKLVYKDGLLVRALRNGDWLVLDELNLAPSDVLEALNRLLDDNRELVVPETGEVIRPHTDFALFATQNPPGLYGGRKPLSRAFRNRFVEVHFDDVPEDELEVILCQRCKIAPSYAKRIISVFKDLQRRRQASRIFETKHSFATLRDLFRWANRGAESVQSLAENGYMLLAERARRADDKAIVREVLQDVLRVSIDPPSLYGHHTTTISLPRQLVLTSAMKRLWTLVGEAIRHDEPVLLVGETGTGKTTVCDLMAACHDKSLYTVNCHLNTETGDLIGGLRPVRDKSSRRNRIAALLRSEMEQAGFSASDSNSVSPSSLRETLDALNKRTDLPSRLATILPEVHQELILTESFVEWKDGPLVEAMRCAGYFLLDEISLADDSVLERLNSVLEPSRSLVLAEMGGRDIDQLSIEAQPGFQLLATMNPGGDYGKKELSPALRNRFTEIYVPSIEEAADRHLIISGSWSSTRLAAYTEPLLVFWEWVERRFQGKGAFGLRDILAWVQFMNKLSEEPHSRLTLPALFHHAACMTFVDALGFVELSHSEGAQLSASVAHARNKLLELVPLDSNELATFTPTVRSTSSEFSIGPFSLCTGPLLAASAGFTFVAPTTHENALRVLRAAQLPKAILLEGSPGVGKTSLIVALASATGRSLCRINLSDQTELTDLFGSDLPVEGGQPGEFGWKSAAFLQSMESGGWVLLDEMNLAPQPVLEGLNAVLDHRAQVYIPELGRAFRCHPDFRVFAAQNPLQQGGDRKGLPKSFLNRFTRVYMSELTDQDYLTICQNLYPKVPEDHLKQLIHFNRIVARDVLDSRHFSSEGSPWDFNLRDLLRWLHLYQDDDPSLAWACQRSFHILYLARLRSLRDRMHMEHTFAKVFVNDVGRELPARPWFELAEDHAQFGQVLSPRLAYNQSDNLFAILHSQLDVLEHVNASMRQTWMVILTGYQGSGKTSIARLIARACGTQLIEFSMNSATDTSDLLGGFEQWSEESDALDLCSRTTALLFEHVSRQPAHRLIVNDMCDKLDRIESSHGHSTPAQKLSTIVAYCSEMATWLSEQKTVNTTRLHDLTHDLQRHSTPQSYKGRFKWVDGPIVRAMREGHWLLLDNANICNSAVLDRLNSVLEDNGKLLLNERGLVDDEIQELQPHPSFRIIMTVDPQYGELSRAMRNRGVEIFVRSPFCVEADRSRLLQMVRCPSTLSLNPEDLFEATLQAKRTRLVLTASTLSAGRKSFSALGLYDSLILTNSKLARHILPVEVSGSAKEARSRSIYLTQAVRVSEASLFRRVHNLLLNEEVKDIFSVPIFFQEFLYQDRFSIARERHLPTSYVSNLPFDHALNPVFDPLFSTGRLQREMFCADVVSVLHLTTSDVRNNVSIGKLLDDRNNSSGLTALHHSARVVTIVVDDILAFMQNILSEVQWLSEAKETATFLLDLADYTKALHDVLLESVPNYSAISVISGWFTQNALLSHRCFVATSASVGALQRSVKPRTGIEMFAIWWNIWNGFAQTGFRYRTLGISQDGVYGQASSYEHMKRLFPDSVQKIHLNTQDASGFNSTLEELAIIPTESGLQIESCDAWTIALSALQYVASFPNDQFLIDSISQMVCSSPGYPTEQLASWKGVLAGHRQSDTLDSALYTPHLLFQWLDSLKLSWDAGEYQVDLDPGLIFTPIELRNTTQSLMQRQTIESLMTFKSALQRRSRHYAVLATRHSPSRTLQMKQLLVKSIQNLCSGFASTYHPDVLDHILDFSILRRSDENDAHAWLNALLGTSNKHLAQAFASYILPAMTPLFRETPSYRDTVRRFAVAWVALSRALLELYLPDIPTDPLVNITSRLDFLQKRKKSLASQLELHEQNEWLMNGHHTNRRTETLVAMLAETGRHIAAIRPPPISRPSDPSSLNAFYREIGQFMEQVLAKEYVDRLIEELSGSAELHGLHMAETVHRSIDSFIQRLGQAYPELGDIAFATILSIRSVQMGIRLATRAGRIHEEPLAYGRALSVSLSQFPKTAAASHFIRDNKELLHRLSTDTLTTPNIILNLCLIAKQVCQDVLLEPDMDVIQALYQLLYSRWSKQQEKDEANRLNQEGLYRLKNEDHIDEPEEERIERELRMLFPDFEQDLKNIGGMADIKPGSPNKSDIGSKTTSQIWTLHSILFSSGDVSPTSWTTVDSLTTEIHMEQLGSLDFSQLTDAVDAGSQMFRLTLLQEALSAFMSRPSTRHGYNDFYWGMNVIELQKAFLILSALRNRLAALIPIWPEQVQLQDILDRCEAVLSLPSESSLAQVLPGLENVVTGIAAWEVFSNRDNSLESYQTQLVELIVGWRRMELSCWAQLLDSECTSFANEVAEWWFLIYGAVIDSTPSDNGANLKELISLLDDFITTSPLGQFRARLDLVASFGFFLKSIARTQVELAGRADLVTSVAIYYAQFSAGVENSLSSQRKPLEDDIRSFVQLASWKDVNVDALKQSAKKTHRRLYQTIRKFRTILRQAVAPLLSIFDHGSTLSDGTDEYSTSSINDMTSPLSYTSGAIPVESGPALQLSTALARLRDLRNSKLNYLIDRDTSGDIELFATSLIETMDEFSSETLRTTNPTMLKALVARKRKAWYDTLKELRSIGLPSRLPAKVLERQTERHSLLSYRSALKSVEQQGPLGGILRKTDAYFNKLCGMIPVLRNVLVGHQRDLPTRDLERAMGFVESAFGVGLKGRHLLAQTCDTHCALQSVLIRLMPVVSSGSELSLVGCGSTTEQRVRTTHSLAIDVLSALREILKGIRLLECYAPLDALTDAALASIDPLLAVQERLVTTLTVLKDTVTSTQPAILLSSELSTLRTAEASMQQTALVLTAMCEKYPDFSCMLEPTTRWLNDAIVTTTDQVYDDPASFPGKASPHDLSSQLITSVLLTAQQLNELAERRHSDDGSQLGVQATEANFEHIVAAFRLENVQHLLSQLLRLESREETQPQPLCAMMPFLQEYSHLVTLAIRSLARHNKATLKLTYVLHNALRSIALNGFCKPQEQDESESKPDSKTATEGVGVGEGTGAEDASADIQDESQVEGTQDETMEQAAKEKHDNDSREDAAFEMEEDFEGILEDVATSGADGDSDTEAEQSDLDETTGHLGSSDPVALDEKLWGDKEAERDSQSEESTAKVPQNSTISNDIGAQGQDKSEDPVSDLETTPAPEDQSKIEDLEDQNTEITGEGEDGSVDALDTKNDIPIGGALDLPEDLDLDQDHASATASDLLDDDRPSSQVPSENNEREHKLDDVEDMLADSIVDDEVNPEDNVETTAEDKQAGPDTKADGDGGGLLSAAPNGLEDITDSLDKDDAKRQPNYNEEQRQPGDHEHEQGNVAAMSSSTTQTEGKAARPQDVPNVVPAQPQTIGHREESDALNTPEYDDHNLKAGDPSQKTIRAAENIQSASAEPMPLPQSPVSGPLEWARPDDESVVDQQALGLRQEDEGITLDQLKLDDEMDGNAAPQGDEMAPESDAKLEDDAMTVDEEGPSDVADRKAIGAIPRWSTDEQDDMEEIIPSAQGNTDISLLRPEPKSDTEHPSLTTRWQAYVSVTQDLAYSLCEQLRLILEPTRATRLQGDYKTGKRLNMRKIIPYIASDYTKDKIWLRRTKPSRREYQVLIALDDSRSMAESRSISLAFQTLSLVASALGKLEVGDVGIIRFGENVEILHDFEEGPVTAEVGERLVSHFKFAQTGTDMEKLLDSSITMLSDARVRSKHSSINASELWQLEIIISDGVCQGHERLRSLIRRAEEEKIVIVFIVLDSLHLQKGSPTQDQMHGSIMSMMQGSYTEIEGRMEIKMNRYMDTFPFSYYIVLRDIEALPDVLASTLRQFFEIK
ncbi:P-loop containing nucleoside triphosphate hydrolase protein [Calocera viscosa TUFC12733]|uniref:Midasin n=1 Tax=Calocera viscosa (strain TUFC12733) TaxID=1330018 RepID=A0A167MSP0_CALVF|nr:P-loop containing nucleoside triphosphate hydrolase protein [Calocera viscosa TUFC12733]